MSFANDLAVLNLAGDTSYTFGNKFTILLWAYPEGNTGSNALLEKKSKDNSVIFSLNLSDTEISF